jgi:cation diffusion facilitator family transporter
MPNRPFASTANIAAAGIAVAVVVLAMKFAAWWITGSIALYSDALESLVNVATAIAALAAIRYGALPPDANHPYGHHKAEYFSVVLEGVLIVIAAISIFRQAWIGILDPQPIAAPVPGLAINVAAALLNGAWCYILIREGRRRRSPALTADGIHLLTDVATSVGVVIGLVLSVATGWHILDPALAALVALNILWAGWRLIRVSIGGLMDEAVPADTLDRIRKIIADNADGAIEAHDIRTRHAGRMTFIEFHLVVPGSMPVSQSHDICDRIEKALRAEVHDSLITIHVEPEDKAKHTGVVVV